MRDALSAGEVLGGIRWDVVAGGVVLLTCVAVGLLWAVVWATRARR